MNSLDAQPSWLVSEAFFSAYFEAANTLLRISNRSTAVYTSARFYGEIYDSTGRLCFTVAFSQDENLPGIHGPFRPGDTRTLLATAYSLQPALRPARLSLWYLGEDSSPQAHVPAMQAPVTVRNTVIKVPTVPAASGGGRPFSPFALLEAVTGVDQSPVSIRVVSSAGEEATRWSRSLASQLRFEPARRGDEQAGVVTTLILIVLVDPTLEKNIPVAAAWDDPWVQAYLGEHRNLETPPVVQLLRLQRTSGAEPFRYQDLGTGWCDQVFHWDYTATPPQRKWGRLR